VAEVDAAVQTERENCYYEKNIAIYVPIVGLADN
jgi:hypothetical protein